MKTTDRPARRQSGSPPLTISDRLKALSRKQRHGHRQSNPDLRELPYGLKKAIKEAGFDDALNMANTRRLLAANVVKKVMKVVDELPPDRQGKFPAELGIEHVPDLEYLVHTRGGREALAQAFREELDTPAKLKRFEQASFMLQADAYPDCDDTHPLCAMWHAGGLHMALFAGTKYNDAAVEHAWRRVPGGGTRRRGRRRKSGKRKRSWRTRRTRRG